MICIQRFQKSAKKLKLNWSFPPPGLQIGFRKKGYGKWKNTALRVPFLNHMTKMRSSVEKNWSNVRSAIAQIHILLASLVQPLAKHYLNVTIAMNHLIILNAYAKRRLFTVIF